MARSIDSPWGTRRLSASSIYPFNPCYRVLNIDNDMAIELLVQLQVLLSNHRCERTFREKGIAVGKGSGCMVKINMPLLTNFSAFGSKDHQTQPKSLKVNTFSSGEWTTLTGAGAARPSSRQLSDATLSSVRYLDL